MHAGRRLVHAYRTCLEEPDSEPTLPSEQPLGARVLEGRSWWLVSVEHCGWIRLWEPRGEEKLRLMGLAHPLGG